MNEVSKAGGAERISKKFWQSKTFWVNILSALGIIVQTKTGFAVDPATQAISLTVVNTALRAVTKESISW